MIDHTALLAELAAIQRDVKTLHQSAIINDHGAETALARQMLERLARLLSTVAAPPPATGGPEPVPHSGAVCSTCGDTHRMWLFNDSGDSRQVMCTRCPRPCQSCRLNGTGPYCATTPCACSCHAPAAKPAAPPPVGLLPVSAASEALVSQLMAANTPTATTSRKLEPVDNGMLAPIRARLDRMEREIAKLDERIERDRFDLDGRVTRLEARIDGGDPGDEQEAS